MTRPVATPTIHFRRFRMRPIWLRPGDVVLIAPGIYREAVGLTESGTAGTGRSRFRRKRTGAGHHHGSRAADGMDAGVGSSGAVYLGLALRFYHRSQRGWVAGARSRRPPAGGMRGADFMGIASVAAGDESGRSLAGKFLGGLAISYFDGLAAGRDRRPKRTDRRVRAAVSDFADGEGQYLFRCAVHHASGSGVSGCGEFRSARRGYSRRGLACGPLHGRGQQCGRDDSKWR
jgi:hypothetical protein